MNVQYNFSLNVLPFNEYSYISTKEEKKEASQSGLGISVCGSFQTQQMAALFMMNISTAKVFLYGFLRFTK